MELTWERVDLSRGVIRLEMTKSGRRREVPLNSESYDALVTLNPRASGRVFRTKSVRKAYENAVTNAKLDDVNFHTLRHTFGSWAVMRGVSLKELQELLGHSSLAMTMRYAHLAPEASARRSRAWKGSPAASPPLNQRKRQRKAPAPSKGSCLTPRSSWWAVGDSNPGPADCAESARPDR